MEYYEWLNDVMGMLQDCRVDTYDPDKCKKLYDEGYDPLAAVDELMEE